MNFKALGMLYFYNKKAYQKTLQVTKLTTIFIITTCMHVSAKGFAQKVSIDAKNMSLEKVFSIIEKETEYVFFFNYDLLRDAKSVTINIKDVNVEEAMVACLKDQPFDFKIVDKTITITKKLIDLGQNAASITIPSEIIGVVKSEIGDPLVGATVIIKSIKKSSITNQKGEFVLKNVPVGTYWIEISFVGYESHRTQIVVSDNIFRLIASLKISNSILDQTQVIAYGTTSPRFSVGNITTVNGADIEKQPVGNALLALEGKVPGLFITQANGISGGGIQVRIQGQNSLANGSDPLYVIDGVPYPSELPPGINLGPLGNSGGITGTTGYTGTGNALSYINPSDIESITILKDADATTIYGSRAANGAILITTKRAKIGQTRVDFNLQQGWGKVPKRINMLNTREYLDMRYEAFKNDGIPISSLTTNGDYDLTVWDTTRYTDWQKVLIGGISQYTNVNASLSGGTHEVQYLIGSTYHRESSVFPGDFADRKGSVHFSLDNNSLNQKFKMQFSASYMVDDNHLPSNDQTANAVNLEPDAPVLYKPDGTLNWAPNVSGISTWSNPLATALYQTFEQKTNNLLTSEMINYHIFTGLDILSRFGYSKIESSSLQLDQLLANRPENRSNGSSVAYYGHTDVSTWIIEPQIEYKKNIGKDKLDLLIGTTFQKSTSIGQILLGQGYNSDQVLRDITSAASIIPISAFDNVYAYNAFYGRLNYNWRNKYIVDVSARRDGSSRFGDKNQFHNFGSAGAAWIFTEEDFIRNTISFISFGKIKASYGSTGSDQIADYSFLNLYFPVPVGVAYQGVTGLGVNSISNPYIQWEETKKAQISTDWGILKDKILFDISYSQNRSSNQLLQYSLPSFVGVGSVLTNLAAIIQNSDWEISLSSKNIQTTNFSWTLSANLTIPKNKLIAFPNLATSSYSYRWAIGQPVNVQRIYHFLGVDTSTGLYQVADSHGNPTSSPGLPDNSNSSFLSTFPKFYGGIENNFHFKGLQLSFLFQFVKQKGATQIFSNGYGIPPGYFSDGGSNQPVSVLNRWRNPGDHALVEKYNTDGSLISYLGNALSSDANVSDASFIRLKNVSLSWDLPMNSIQKAYLKNCVIYVQAQNILTLTHYQGALDPETQSLLTLPPLRVITIGMKVGF